MNDIWHPNAKKAPRERPEYYKQDSYKRNEYDGYGSKIPKFEKTARLSSGKRLPTSRADHAARLLLDNMATLETLSAEDHHLLGSLEAPHGPLFSWLESQWHEHGAQPWVALREGLRGHVSEEFALKLMSGYELGTANDAPEAFSELRHLLNRMLIEQLKTDETLAIEVAKADPSALQRYRALQARRLLLESCDKSTAPT